MEIVGIMRKKVISSMDLGFQKKDANV